MASNFYASVPNAIDAGPLEEPCYACGNTAGNRLVLTQGPVDAASDGPTPEDWRFRVCAACGSMSLLLPPDDAGAHYAGAYYSFNTGQKPFAERKMIAMRNRYEMTGRGPLGKALAKRWPGPQHRSLRPLLEGTLGPRLTKASRILDVGCGAGAWLKELATEGFTSLVGVDPMLSDSQEHGSIKIIKGTAADAEGHFDLIAVHHAFEHIADGVEALAGMTAKLAEGGILLIRIPLGASYGWMKYGGHWVQLDPPRHMHLYSIKGLKALASRAGFETLHVCRDSSHFMVTGSKARTAGFRFHSGQVLPGRAIQTTFGRDQGNRIAEFTNRLGMGDQAAFYLRPSAAV